MKNIYLHRIWMLISVLILTYSQAWATDVSITFSDKYNSNITLDETGITIATGITATFNKRSGGTATQYYTNGTSVRWYGGGTLVIASSVGNITGVSITYTRTDNSISADVGTWESPDWSGSATSITFTQGGTSGHLRISAISVTYTASAPATPYTVTFTKTDGTTQAITEASVGGGVTPPTMQATCGDWEFQGWSASESDDNESTDELALVTLTTGKYYPSSNITLYPVYTKTESGGSGSETFTKSDYSNTNGTISATKNGITISCVGNIPSGSYVTFTENNTLTISSTSGNITAIDFTCTNNDYTGNLSDVSDISTTSWSISVDNPGNKTTVRVSSIDVTYSGGSTTYYYSYPTCTPPCTELGQINGSVNLTNYKHLYLSIITLNIMLLQMNKHVKYRSVRYFTCRIVRHLFIVFSII